MSSLKKLFDYLQSLWGLLSIAAALFPGAAALLKLPLAVENSRIADLYPLVPMIGAAFALLFLTQFKDRLMDLSLARAIALRAFALGILSFFAFATVRVAFLDVRYESRRDEQNGSVLITEGRNRGLVMREARSTSEDGRLLHAEEAGDPWDVAVLALFTGAFTSFSVAFGALGLHAFYANELREGDAG